MKRCDKFILDFMNRYNYPEDAARELLRIEKRLDDETDFGSEEDRIRREFFSGDNGNLHEILEKVRLLAKKYNENTYTMHFIFVLNCMPDLYQKYLKAGIPEQIFWDTMYDMRCKLIECIKCKEVPGSAVADWFDGFLNLTRFAYGRFQYEEREYDLDFDFTSARGVRLTKGAKLINFHIPSSGVPLTDEVRFDSYKKAYGHYKHLFPDGRALFWCQSWLLFPRHKEFLPRKSNILKFLSDFEIVEWGENEKFYDGWRVFDKYADLPPEELPTDTSLRKALAEWMKKGNKTGYGKGVIVFDGEKIVR